MTIGDRLKRIRKNSGLTQTDVSKATGINNKTLSGYENNVSTPDPDTCLILANFYAVSPEYILYGAKFDQAITQKDEKDIAKSLEELKNKLESQSGLLFSGDAIDDETREFLLASLERTIRQSKVLAKEKFTPNKYK